MSSGATRRAASEFTIVEDGPYAAVRLAPEVHAEYMKLSERNDKLSKQQRTHLRRYLERFCQLGHQSLNDEKFKFEDSLSDGRGGHVAVFAFKPFQWRLYGSILTVAGKRCFVGVRVDPSKKQDKANQALLKAAAQDIAALSEYGR